MDWALLAGGIVLGFCGGWLYHTTNQEYAHQWLERFNTLRHEEWEANKQGSRVLARQRALERLIAELREEAFGVSQDTDGG